MPHTQPNPSINPNRAGRKRRVAGWMLVTLGLLVAAVWFASRWWALSCFVGKTGEIGINQGLLSYFAHRTGNRWGLYDNRGGRGEWFWDAMNTKYWRAPNAASHVVDCAFVCYAQDRLVTPWTLSGYSVVLWPIPLLLWTPAALLLRSGIVARRRASAGMCKKCGYDLAGLGAGAPCPECGKGAVTT